MEACKPKEKGNYYGSLQADHACIPGKARVGKFGKKHIAFLEHTF